MILTKREAEIIERLRVNESTKSISAALGVSRATMQKLLNGLADKSAILRPGIGFLGYKVLIDVYDVLNVEEAPKHVEPKKVTQAMKVLIPDGYDDYIRGHYNFIPRRELARRLNLDKITLNRMIIQLGLGS